MYSWAKCLSGSGEYGGNWNNGNYTYYKSHEDAIGRTVGREVSALIFSGKNNNTFRGVHFTDGTSWYTQDGEDALKKLGINQIAQGGGGNWGEGSMWYANMMKYAGFMVGNTSNILTYWGKSHLYNELWHSTRTRGIATALNKTRWNNSMAIKWRNVQTAPLKGVRTAGTKFARIGGGVMIVADIALSGELKPSQLINAGAAMAAGSGIGSLVGVAWFAADFGTMGVNILLGNGAVGLGDVIDNAFGTIEMYEGLY